MTPARKTRKPYNNTPNKVDILVIVLETLS